MKSESNILAEAQFIVDNNATVRKTASEFGRSKSSVHKDVTENLRNISPTLYAKVQEVLQKNKAERHYRGGNATKLKYANARTEKSLDW